MPPSSEARPTCRHRYSKTGNSQYGNGLRSDCPMPRRRCRWTVSCTTATCSTSAAAPHVLEIPGHTEGSIAIHLPAHGVLFTGDTIANVGSVMLGTFNQDRARTVASFQRLAALEVETACFGHGEPIVSASGRPDPRGGCHTDDSDRARHQGLDLGDRPTVPGMRFRPVQGAPHRGRRPHSRRRRRLGAQAQRTRRPRAPTPYGVVDAGVRLPHPRRAPDLQRPRPA